MSGAITSEECEQLTPQAVFSYVDGHFFSFDNLKGLCLQSPSLTQTDAGMWGEARTHAVAWTHVKNSGFCSPAL